MAVEEEDGADGLILGGWGYVSFCGKVGDELVDFRGSHFFWVALFMIEDVFPDPLDVGFACARGVLFGADGVLVLFEEFFLWFLLVGYGRVLCCHFVLPLSWVWVYNLCVGR